MESSPSLWCKCELLPWSYYGISGHGGVSKRESIVVGTINKKQCLLKADVVGGCAKILTGLIISPSQGGASALRTLRDKDTET